MTHFLATIGEDLHALKAELKAVIGGVDGWRCGGRGRLRCLHDSVAGHWWQKLTIQVNFGPGDV
jgi:hypothetical protein